MNSPQSTVHSPQSTVHGRQSTVHGLQSHKAFAMTIQVIKESIAGMRRELSSRRALLPLSSAGDAAKLTREISLLKSNIIAMNNHLNGLPQKQPGMQQRRRILKAVAEEFGVTPAELRGPLRKQTYSQARSVYAYLMRARLNAKWMTIAGDLNKDHSSMVEAVERMQDYIFTRNVAALKLRKIEEELSLKQII